MLPGNESGASHCSSLVTASGSFPRTQEPAGPAELKRLLQDIGLVDTAIEDVAKFLLCGIIRKVGGGSASRTAPADLSRLPVSELLSPKRLEQRQVLAFAASTSPQHTTRVRNALPYSCDDQC